MRIIVTGGNSGVGKATATALAAAGHCVVIACRTIGKAEQAAAEMAGHVDVAHLDLADLANVHRFADSVETVDVLVNNAGVLGMPLTRTVDGFEAHIGTNYRFVFGGISREHRGATTTEHQPERADEFRNQSMEHARRRH